jgi:rare lipoprotein A
MQRARVAVLGARIAQVSQGRTRQYRVEIGPLDDVARAEAALDQAQAAGMPDARIVVK